MKIVNLTQKTIICDQAKLADTFWLRFKGLMGTAELRKGHGLIIKPCYSIHTFGMKYDIDVLFIGDGNRVIKVVENLPPGKMVASFEARFVVELPAGTARHTGTVCGDSIMIS